MVNNRDREYGVYTNYGQDYIPLDDATVSDTVQLEIGEVRFGASLLPKSVFTSPYESKTMHLLKNLKNGDEVRFWIGDIPCGFIVDSVEMSKVSGYLIKINISDVFRYVKQPYL